MNKSLVGQFRDHEFLVLFITIFAGSNVYVVHCSKRDSSPQDLYTKWLWCKSRPRFVSQWVCYLKSILDKVMSLLCVSLTIITGQKIYLVVSFRRLIKHWCKLKNQQAKLVVLKFIYSEKATKFCEIFTLLLTVCTVVKSKVKISQKFVAFFEYMNFTSWILKFRTIEYTQYGPIKNGRIKNQGSDFEKKIKNQPWEFWT